MPSRRCPSTRAALQALVVNDPVQRRRAQQVEERIREYVEFATPLVALVKETPWIGRRPARRGGGQTATPTTIQGVFDQFLTAEDALAADAGRDAERRSNLAVIVGAIGIGASAALIILFGVFLARSIGRPVRAVASGATGSRPASGRCAYRHRGPARSASSPTRSTTWRSGSSRTTRSSRRRTPSCARASG